MVSYYIRVRSFRQLRKTVANIFQKETLRLRRRLDLTNRRAVNKFTQVLSTRLRNAPYSSRSRRPGPWSRNGGRPSEDSIRWRRIRTRRRTIYRVYMEDQGKVPNAIPPSKYIQIEDHGPWHWVDETINDVLKDIDRAIRNL